MISFVLDDKQNSTALEIITTRQLYNKTNTENTQRKGWSETSLLNYNFVKIYKTSWFI